MIFKKIIKESAGEYVLLEIKNYKKEIVDFIELENDNENFYGVLKEIRYRKNSDIIVKYLNVIDEDNNYIILDYAINEDTILSFNGKEKQLSLIVKSEDKCYLVFNEGEDVVECDFSEVAEVCIENSWSGDGFRGKLYINTGNEFYLLSVADTANGEQLGYEIVTYSSEKLIDLVTGLLGELGDRCEEYSGETSPVYDKYFMAELIQDSDIEIDGKTVTLLETIKSSNNKKIKNLAKDILNDLDAEENDSAGYTRYGRGWISGNFTTKESEQLTRHLVEIYYDL